jgi:hypothetical protein
MGILDDAIREHLDLKRQHGAENDDLERLENEAFGPAARPGDPDFADPDAEAVEEPAHAEDDSDWLAEGETTLMPGPSTPAEEARAEHPELGETADHPAPVMEEEPVEPPAAAAPEVAEPPPPIEEPEPPAEPEPEVAEESAEEPPEAPERAIFDADDVEFGDLDLELDDEDDDPSVAAATEAPVSEPPPPPPDVFEDDEPAAAPAPAEEPPAPEGDADEEEEEDSAGGQGDDLLEETPDFLQETPEGERLWFEQGAPKDFDFDDD